MNFPSRSDWLFSLKAFIASMLALYLALLFDLPRPYWSMAAVYIVANPLAGATRSKGIYRALGSLIGGAAAVVLLPTFGNAPVLMTLAMSLWTGTLLYISMLDRTPRSYVFMLAGYTLPLIALPSVDDPSAVFDTAVARTEEITLGIICASIVNAIVFPMSVGGALSARISQWLGDAGEWATEILGGKATAGAPLARQKLASDLNVLDLFLTQISHDAATVDIVKQAKILRGRLLMLLPVLSSLADRLHGLRAADDQVDVALQHLLDDIAAWGTSAQKRADGASAEQLRRRIEALKAATSGSLWSRLMRLSALARLQELVDLVEDCDALRAQIASGSPDRRWRGKSRYRDFVRTTRHYDYPLMLLSAGLVVLATFISTQIWIFTGWDSGAGFVTMVAVACSFFAAMDRPAPMMRVMLIFTGVSLVGAGIYLFAILPMVHDYWMLVAVFALPFLLVGAVIPQPQFYIATLLTLVNMASYVALQDRFSADFATFVNGGLAAVLGVGFALVWTLLTRPFGEELAAKRLVRQGWRDLALTAAGVRSYDQTVLSARLLDRLSQLTPRVAKIDQDDLRQIDGLAEVRVGFNILELQRERRALGDKSPLIPPVLSGIAAFYGDRVRTRTAVPPPKLLLDHIDAAIGGLATERNSDSADAALNSLIGLRRVLFVDAPPPFLPTPEEDVAEHLHAAE